MPESLPASSPAPRPAPDVVARPARRPDRGGPASTVVAVVLDTAPGAAADRLGGQLAALAVRELHVVTRVAGPRPPASRVTVSGGLPDDLRAVATVARACTGPMAVLPGDLVAHTEALALLLADPSRGTAALVSPPEKGTQGKGTQADGVPGREPPGAVPPVRVEHGRVVAAGNSFHVVTAANGAFRGVLHVGVADLATFAEVADELADLAQAGVLGDATAGEAVDLLLAGLVRLRVPVRAAPLGLLRAVRVTGEGETEAAIERLAEVDEGRARLAATVRSGDGFTATYLVSTWTGPLVRLAAHLGMTPSTVTGLSVGLAGLAAVAFSAGSRRALVAGAALLYLSFVLDCVDGRLARYTRTFSPVGAWLDATFARVKEYAVYFGLAVGYAGSVAAGPTGPDGIWAMAVAAMLLQSLRHMIDFAYMGARHAGLGLERPDGALARPTAPDTPGRGRLAVLLDRDTRAYWLRKIIVLPVGERVLLIALTAALANAHVTFLALLAWGGLATLYTLTGRIARSL
ncbi:CDP-alcohol phosphatidyltransferase family protein [Sphaerisporangium sp. B11E5]|uniref:CDP-alcohol phosphatidyltransferase family protein n=1 Tax=Sphaerisporangium sp. B11E5 TaxID=3153563 RepID=UPI00325C9984